MTPYWVKNILGPFQNLAGHEISSASYVREPIRWQGDDEVPVYSDRRIPFDLVCPMYLLIDGMTWIKIVTYQNDTENGLKVADGVPFEELFADPDGRESKHRVEKDFPYGSVQLVEPFEERGLVSEMLLVIDDRPVLLVAGEIEEDFDDNLELIRNGDSICVLTDREPLESCRFRDGEGPVLASRFLEISRAKGS